MFARKTNKPSHALSVSQITVSLKETPVWADLWQLFWFAGALFTLMALASYSPLDPSWTTWSSKSDFHNWMGRSGSIVSDLMFQLFGVSSFVLIALMVRTARAKKENEAERLTRFWSLTSTIIFLFSVSALAQGIVGKSWLPWRLNNPGGLTGHAAMSAWKYAAGPIGGLLANLVLTLASAILLFRWKAITQSVAFLRKTAEEVKLHGPEILKARWETLKVSLKERFKKSPPIASGHTSVTATQSPALPAPILPVPVMTSAQQLELETSSSEPEISTSPTDDEEIFTLMGQTTVGEMAMGAKAPAPIKRKRNTDPFVLPNVNALAGKADSKVKSVEKSWYLDKANILVQKLKDFGVEGEVVHISPGPVITVYEFKPASGVKIKDISNLSDDLTLALSVLSVRIVAPIPGKPVVGIEIPSPHREMVFFKDLVQETPFFNDEIRIPVALGRLASGEPVTADLAAMPHLLVAGATGTGKSVFINTLISSLLYRFTPQQLKLILVDPKMVELSLYEGIPHLLLPVVVDSKKAALALRWAIDEMERRYTLMHHAGVRHLDAYNAKLGELKATHQAEADAEAIPYIVIVIDEYADLMAVVPKDVELSIARLAQKARASGIHLVLATQRPSTDVVTGTIKANFPSRISFRVASSVDAKTILDRTGSERLLGHGDMLFHSAGFATLKRMQGAFIADSDVHRLVDFLKAQGEPEYDEKILRAAEEGDMELPFGEGEGEEGRLYDQAVRIVTEKGEASISLIQRHLRIGYNRAAMLMEQMEKEGVVSPSTGNSKRRSVLASSL